MIIQVCVGSSCHLKGSQDIVMLLQDAIAKHHLDHDLVRVGKNRHHHAAIPDGFCHSLYHCYHCGTGTDHENLYAG